MRGSKSIGENFLRIVNDPRMSEPITLKIVEYDEINDLYYFSDTEYHQMISNRLATRVAYNPVDREMLFRANLTLPKEINFEALRGCYGVLDSHA